MRSPIVAWRLRRAARVVFLIWFLAPLVSEQLIAKTVGLTAIEVYPSGNGMSYEQISGFILNAKNEVALCGESAHWDKSAYHKLTKVLLTPGMSLERDSKGVLMLTQESGSPACVVPANLKLDKGDDLTPSSLADKAAMEGTVLPASDPQQTQIFPLKTGVKIVMVAAPSQELAEYLRADKAAEITTWESYLKKWGGGAHATAAKKALSQLYVASASADFADYTASKGKDPEYAKLKAARQLTDQAKALIPDYKDALSLSDRIHSEIVALSRLAQAKVAFYRSMMEQQKTGYSNLPEAEKLAQNALDIEPQTAEAIEAGKQAKQARNSLDQALKDAEAMIAAKRPAEAEKAIKPLVCFSTEVARISDDLHKTSALYVDRSKEFEEAGKWPEAVDDLTKADELVPSPETHALLLDTKQRAHDADVKSAADEAMHQSAAFESSGDTIRAFEVLDDLPKESRDQVSQHISELQEKFVKEAEEAAKKEKDAHYPIKGLADEIGIQTAWEYLQRCYRLTSDPEVQDSILVLSDELSRYYLQQGTKYSDKPGGIGSNVGWKYLNESLQYRSAANASAAHEELERARPAHQLKSKLSVRVDFRDGTSRREGAQFAEQLDEALASGLESTDSQIRIVRQESPSITANFQLIGDVLAHSKTPEIQNIPKQSRYSAGEAQLPNDAWAQVNREIDKINRQLDTDRSQYQGATSRGKKKEILEAQNLIAQDSAKVEKLQAQLDRIPKTLSQPVIRDYTYTEVVHNVAVTVDLQFHILDNAGTEIIPRMQIHKETPHSYKEFKNVKAEDSEGVKDNAVIPDENKFFEQTENDARDELIQDAKKNLSDLPGIVLRAADRKSGNGDSDGAAELYILYLNCTPVADTPERSKAQKYLRDTFNFRDIGTTPPED